MKKTLSTIGIGVFMFAFHYAPHTEQDKGSTLLQLNPWASPAFVRKCDDLTWEWYSNSTVRPLASEQRRIACSHARRTSRLMFNPIPIKHRL